MNLEARKIAFMQEFLKLQSEDVISRLENIVRNQTNIPEVKIVEPMTQETLNRRMGQSEADFKNNRFKSSSELLAKYEIRQYP